MGPSGGHVGCDTAVMSLVRWGIPAAVAPVGAAAEGAGGDVRDRRAVRTLRHGDGAHACRCPPRVRQGGRLDAGAREE